MTMNKYTTPSFTILLVLKFVVFFFNDTAPTEIYTLSLHDALPISIDRGERDGREWNEDACERCAFIRSEEHTSELQSHVNLVCRLLLEKKKAYIVVNIHGDSGPLLAQTKAFEFAFADNELMRLVVE